ncbi:MAG: VWA domain-containing protein, partial [Desulfuromonadales bacterium]
LRDSSSAQSKPRTEQEQKNLSRAAANDEVKSAESVDVGGILKKALDSEHRQACQQGRLVKIPGTHVAGESSSADIDQRACEKALGIDQVRRETAQLRARLAGLLQARRRQWAFPRSMGQRVDDRAVYRLGCTTPDLRIFASRRQQVAPDTAVLLLGDRSGSMHGPKMRLAQQSAYLTAEALELLPGVACAVGFFPWGEQVVRLKGFGEKLKTSHFTLSASGSTPMAEALLWAGMELTQRREPRKIVIVLTDGQPDEVEDAVAALEKLSACGIECYGIGIQDRSILTWMREGARTIEQSAELPGALVSVLQTLLVRRPGSVAA